MFRGVLSRKIAFFKWQIQQGRENVLRKETFTSKTVNFVESLSNLVMAMNHTLKCTILTQNPCKSATYAESLLWIVPIY